MYLKDKPYGEDLFESSSHKKLADAMLEVICNENLEIDIIGLEGEWGSGKSNVIDIIKKQLNDTHHFFIYDAWGHQEDLQRRAFLEEFTDELIDNNLLDDTKNWKEKLKDLLARKIEKTSKTVPKLNISYLYIIAIIFINSLTKNLSYEAIESIFPQVLVDYIKVNFDNLFLKSLTINVLRNFPVFFSIIVFLGFMKYRAMINKSISFLDRIKNSLAELLQIYRKQELENKIETITSTLEPSVREFENWMDEISSALNKKVVVVFDNMDRLPSSKAKKLWSSIHTFFSETHYESIRVIVPFDRYQIRKIFTLDDSSTENYEADKFIDKTFSLVYRVSPPVMSDWKNYFSIKFGQLKLECSKEEFIEVRNLYDFNIKQIKPREVILFLNELYLLNNIWNNEIPLKYIALFILKKEEILKNPVEMVLSSNLTKNTANLFDDDVQKYISALVFNINPEHATQVLLEREIANAIRMEEIDIFNSYKASNEFNHIFERYLNNIESLESTIRVVYKSLFTDENETNLTKVTISTLENMFLKSKIITKFLDDYMKYLILMSPNKKNLIISAILDASSVNEEITGKEYYILIRDLTNFIDENQLNLDIKTSLKKKHFKINDFFDFLESSKIKQNEFNIISDISSIENNYLSMIEEENFDIKKIELLKYIDFDNRFNDLKNRISEFIDNQEFTVKNVEGIIKLKLGFEENRIEEKWNLDTLYMEFYNNFDVNEESTYIMAAMMISYMAEDDYSSTVPSKYIALIEELFNRDNNAFMKGVFKYIYSFTHIGMILKLVTNVRCKDIDNLAFMMLENGVNSLNIKKTLSIYDNVIDQLGVDKEFFVKFLNRWKLDGISVENIFDVFESDRFLNDSINFNLRITNDVLKIYNDYYKSKDNSYFLELFDENIETLEFDIFYTLFSNKVFKKLSANIFVAYAKCLEKGLKYKKIGKKQLNLFMLIYNIIDKRKMRGTMNNIRDLLITTYDILECDYEYYLPLLFKHSILKSKTEDVLRKIINPLLSSGYAIEIILEFKDKLIELANESENEKYNLRDLLETIGKEEVISSVSFEEVVINTDESS